jgi:hypothetical protein
MATIFAVGGEAWLVLIDIRVTPKERLRIASRLREQQQQLRSFNPRMAARRIISTFG